MPVGELVKLCFSGKHTERELVRKLTSQAGLGAYLVYQAMGYQIAKEIGSMAVILEGKVAAAATR